MIELSVKCDLVAMDSSCKRLYFRTGHKYPGLDYICASWNCEPYIQASQQRAIAIVQLIWTEHSTNLWYWLLTEDSGPDLLILLFPFLKCLYVIGTHRRKWHIKLWLEVLGRNMATQRLLSLLLQILNKPITPQNRLFSLHGVIPTSTYTLHCRVPSQQYCFLCFF